MSLLESKKPGGAGEALGAAQSSVFRAPSHQPPTSTSASQHVKTAENKM